MPATDVSWESEDGAFESGSDESFESAAPVSRDQLARADSSDEDSDSGDMSSPTPALEERIGRIPERNRRNVEEIFRGKFTSVRKLDRRKLV